MRVNEVVSSIDQNTVILDTHSVAVSSNVVADNLKATADTVFWFAPYGERGKIHERIADWSERPMRRPRHQVHRLLGAFMAYTYIALQ